MAATQRTGEPSSTPGASGDPLLNALFLLVLPVACFVWAFVEGRPLSASGPLFAGWSALGAVIAFIPHRTLMVTMFPLSLVLLALFTPRGDFPLTVMAIVAWWAGVTAGGEVRRLMGREAPAAQGADDNRAGWDGINGIERSVRPTDRKLAQRFGYMDGVRSTILTVVKPTGRLDIVALDRERRLVFHTVKDDRGRLRTAQVMTAVPTPGTTHVSVDGQELDVPSGSVVGLVEADKALQALMAHGGRAAELTWSEEKPRDRVAFPAALRQFD